VDAALRETLEENKMLINTSMIAEIATALDEYRDDESTFWDTLDGETDVLDVLDMLIAQTTADNALAASLAAQIEAMGRRKSRIEARAKAAKSSIGMVLSAARMKKAERPAATVSVRAGNLHVKIVDEDDIPTQMKRTITKVSPDKKAIKEHLETGVDVPGAILDMGADIVTVRVA
jgi:hypothetical protein